jgi:predicted TIM-barrel fold metal-dependent hydrolase
MSQRPVEEWIISADDHVIEPPDLWTSRLPAKYQGPCPQVREDDQGEAWHFDGKRIVVGAAVASAGTPPEEYDPRPLRYADLRPACYEPKARLAAMDEDGILGSMIFPNLPRFCGQEFFECRDRDLGLLCVKAYNDFVLEEWSAVAPGRMIPLIIIPLWDPHLAAKEIDRCAGMGARSLCFSEFPPALGLPSIYGDYWDPVFAAAQEADMPISIHVGSSSSPPGTSADASPMVTVVLISWLAATTCVDWLFSKVFVKFPRLRLTLSEGGIGWVPFMIERTRHAIHDKQYHNRFEVERPKEVGGNTVAVPRASPVKAWPHDGGPLDVFAEHVRGCFVGRFSMAREAIDALGPDLFLSESDFPHGDSTFPHTLDRMEEVLEGLAPEAKYKLRQGNAISWYSLDPAKLEVPQAATV